MRHAQILLEEASSTYATISSDQRDVTRWYKRLVSSLAATFVDAIYVCLVFEISLLWIDSLCIIQDGPNHLDDWQNHLAEMCRMFENCTLIISANHGQDAEASCFTSRDTNEVKMAIIELPGEHGTGLVALCESSLVDCYYRA